MNFSPDYPGKNSSCKQKTVVISGICGMIYKSMSCEKA